MSQAVRYQRRPPAAEQRNITICSKLTAVLPQWHSVWFIWTDAGVSALPRVSGQRHLNGRHRTLPATSCGRRKSAAPYTARPRSLVIVLITVGVSRLKPAAPSVDRATVWIDTVKRGADARARSAAPARWCPKRSAGFQPTTQGRVERILLRPGAQVDADTVILELSNPDLQQSVKDAQLAYQSAQAAFQNRKTELESALLNQQADVAGIEAILQERGADARSQRTAVQGRARLAIQLQAVPVARRRTKNRLAIGQQRLKIATNGIKSQLAPQEADVAQRRATYQLRLRQLDDLKVKAGMTGVLQLVPVEVGAQIGPGTNLARVADPTNLKAELRIAETQTKDIRIGQVAEVDTRNGIVKGKVSRIDPAATGRHGWRGRHPRGRAAARRASGPERRRHHSARAARRT